MKSRLVLAFCLGLFAGSSFASEDPMAAKAKLAVEGGQAQLTVTSINHESREVVLKNEAGDEQSFVIGKEARNLDQVEVGDILEVEYYESVVIFSRDVEGDLTPEAKVAATRTPKGDKPGMAISETVTIKVVVEAIDYDTRVITLKGPEGKTMTKHVDDSVERLNEVKKGDEIVIQLTTALAITVREP